MMRYVNRFLIALTVLYWLGVCLVLAITYPVGHDYQQGLLTAERTAAIYAEMAFCIWLLAILTWSLLAWTIKKRVYLRATMAFVSMTASLGAYGLFIFRASPRLKGQFVLVEMHAHFFREYEALKFTWVTAPLCALLLAIMIVTSAKISKVRVALQGRAGSIRGDSRKKHSRES
jgi:hypothetical protein